MPSLQYKTPNGILVTRTSSKLPFKRGLKHVMERLDSRRGIYLSSGYEYPERYSRWDFASVCPPIEIVAWQREVAIRPLNGRGEILCKLPAPVLAEHPHWDSFGLDGTALR